MESAPGAETVIDGRRYAYFAGTSYLGLAGRREVVEAACAAVRRYGMHTATSRAGFGNNPPLLEVERLAATFFGTAAAFYFISGYVSNHILVQALAGESTVVFLDKAAHYCVEEAAKLAGHEVVRFGHRDPASLAECLQRKVRPGQRPMVLTDGVFPVTGALAPVPDYLQVLEQFAGAALIIDDAHGIAVCGEQGRGTLEWYGLWNTAINDRVDPSGVGLFVGGTLSKAMGGFGGVIPTGANLRPRLLSAAHYYDGASAPPSPVAAATAKAIEIVLAEPGLREQLSRNSRQLRRGLQALGVAVEDWPTANIGVRIGNAANMQRLHGALKGAGFLVPYVASYPGIGREGLLRFAVCAAHTAETIDALLSSLRSAL